MKQLPNVDWIKSYSRARKNAWAKLCNGGPLNLPPSDPRHEQHAIIMHKLHAGILNRIRIENGYTQ